MKILKTLGLVLLTLMLSFSTFAVDEPVIEAGLTPDSPFYFMDTVQEEVSLFFTFNQERKAEKNLEYAQERLSEMSQLQDGSKLEKLQTRFNNQLEESKRLRLITSNAMTQDGEFIIESQYRNQFEDLENQNQEQLKNQIQNKETSMNKNEFQTSLNKLLTTFEGDSFEVVEIVDSNKKIINYYLIKNGMVTKLGEPIDTTYTITIKDKAKFDKLANDYVANGNIDLVELNNLVDIPLKLKTKLLANSPELLRGNN